MEKFHISSSHPLPKSQLGDRNKYKYPWIELGVGQSFFVPFVPKPPGPGIATEIQQYTDRVASFRGMCINAGKKLGKTFTSRRSESEIKPGVRVWRAA